MEEKKYWMVYYTIEGDESSEGHNAILNYSPEEFKKRSMHMDRALKIVKVATPIHKELFDFVANGDRGDHYGFEVYVLNDLTYPMEKKLAGH